MLVTRDFVFVHVPKTAGRFLRAVLHEHFEVVYEHPLHPYYDQLPPEYSELPAVCIVRNPWDWYVSLYHFVHHVKDREPERVQGYLWTAVMGEGDMPFKDAITKACTVRELGGPTPAWLAVMRELDSDYYTAMHHLATGRSDPRLEVARFEALDTDLVAFLESHGIAYPKALPESIRTSEPVNAGRREHYRSYYDSDLSELVSRSCPLVARYGYKF
jgi:hypothetical protein